MKLHTPHLNSSIAMHSNKVLSQVPQEQKNFNLPWSYEVAHVTLEQLNCYAYKGISLVSKYTPMEVIFNYDLLLMKIKITYLILSPLVICYFRLILIFDLDHFLGDLPYLWR